MAESSSVQGAAAEISLVEAVWRYRRMAVLIVLATMLAAVAATQLLFGQVQATARFAVTDPTATTSSKMGISSGAGFATYTAQRAAFAQSAPVLRRAADLVKGQGGPSYSLEQMRGSVKTASKTDGGIVEVVASGSSMQLAAAKANAVLQSYQELTAQAIGGKRDTQLKSLRDAQRKVVAQLANATGKEEQTLAINLTKLQAQESTLLVQEANSNDGVQFVDQADPNASAPSKLPRNAVIGLAVGVLIAMVVSFLRASAPGELAVGTARPRRARTTDGGGGLNGGLNGGPSEGGVSGGGAHGAGGMTGDGRGGVVISGMGGGMSTGGLSGGGFGDGVLRYAGEPPRSKRGGRRRGSSDTTSQNSDDGRVPGDSQVWPREGASSRRAMAGVDGKGDSGPLERRTGRRALTGSGSSGGAASAGEKKASSEHSEHGDRSERGDRRDRGDRSDRSDRSDKSGRRERGSLLGGLSNEILDRPTEPDMPAVRLPDEEETSSGHLHRASDLLNYRDER